MASLTIRNLDETIKSQLRLQAARHGWSMEQEVREILRLSVAPDENSIGLAEKIHRRFASLEADALPIPERHTTRTPPVVEG